MPVYLHKQLRVCTLTKPYFLGHGSARKHHIPISSVPCLQYRRQLEKEKQEIEAAASAPITDSNSDQPPLPVVAKVETLKDNRKEKSLDYAELREYCMRLFQFKKVTIRKFKSWTDRRSHAHARKLAQRPSLPETTKLITCSVNNPRVGIVSSNDLANGKAAKTGEASFGNGNSGPVGSSPLKTGHKGE